MMSILRKALAVPAAALFLLMAAGAANAAPAGKVYHAGSCRASGGYAVCDAAGTAYSPTLIAVHVSASPAQSVLVSWDVTCSKGSGAGSSSGQFTARTTLRRVLHHPYAHPDSCIVSAAAQLSAGGRLHVWITYRR